ncbi:uncharacterized protein LOC118417557 [Branchiostoma floridae]|uniref:Uncharacterized protein LOC118417557 n=1 Tax=Branchiostoma floridae TaxID=7739 RepID=A0A9J7LCF4_BRAFL|nr:uncharacterized protein LOC118417557 [Branchiostoma floridae]
MTAPTWTSVIPIILFSGATTLTDGSAMFIQYPPSTVEGGQGDDKLLSFAANGTEEHESIVIQGPNPITGSNKFVPVYELGAGEEDPHEPFKGNFSVSIAWFNGITVVNLTILDFQLGEVGLYKLSVGFHTGPDINVTMNDLNGSDEGITNNTAATALMTTGSHVNNTGSASSGGLPGGSIAAIVIVVVLPIIAIVVAGGCIYKRRNGRPPQVPPQRYDPVHNGGRDPHDNRFMQGDQGGRRQSFVTMFDSP